MNEIFLFLSLGRDICREVFEVYWINSFNICGGYSGEGSSGERGSKR